jgi:CheY-like chemotaxis protein
MTPAPVKKKVLVIDDSEIVLAVVRGMLEEAGFSVVTLASPFGTTPAIAREKPDLVLLDWKMPGLNGDKIVEMVRNSEKLRRTVVVLYSDRPHEELAATARACGADGYMQKTNDSSRLVHQVTTWIATRSQVPARQKT